MALQIYSDSYMKCALCGFDDFDCLTIDHIYGGGHKHMKQLKKEGTNLQLWLKKNNYPDGYRVLCWNCQQKEKMKQYKCVVL